MIHAFATKMGTCELRWEGPQLTSVRLLDAAVKPSASSATSPPAFVREAAAALARHLDGKPQDLRALPLALGALPPFFRRVYERAREIGPGRTVTYGELAALAGSPGASRAVGQAMAKNPFIIVVPCHRILAGSGRLGGFSAPGGAATKRRLLAMEGVTVGVPPLAFDAAAAEKHLRRVDPRLARVMDRAGPYRPERDPHGSIFDALGRSIIFQQLNGRAAGTIHGRYAALFPGGTPKAAAMASIPDAKLRGAGLSAAKLAALRDLAAKATRREIPELRALGRMGDDEIVERLTTVRGIGPWTVHMLLLFYLGRPDVLPTSDYGVRKGFAVVYGKSDMPSEKELAEHAEVWRPFRSVASWYLWRALEPHDS